jgi:hypothetical protein
MAFTVSTKYGVNLRKKKKIWDWPLAAKFGLAVDVFTIFGLLNNQKKK